MGLDNRDSADKAENGYVEVQEVDVPVAKAAGSMLAVKSAYLRECLAEFIGTAILIAFG
ncbi:Npp1 protein, partial [Globisporangium polare]